MVCETCEQVLDLAEGENYIDPVIMTAVEDWHWTRHQGDLDAIIGHVDKHGEGVCPKHTRVVFDVLVYCPNCRQPMEHHCCHKCCMACGVMDSPRSEF